MQKLFLLANDVRTTNYKGGSGYITDSETNSIIITCWVETVILPLSHIYCLFAGDISGNISFVNKDMN